MLEDLGLVVHFVPAVSQNLHEECFQEAVPAHHFDGVCPAGGRQFDAAIGGMRDQALLGQPTDAVRNG
ncbi:hypothetical protein AHiyo4_44600 [Arthrobacter sp. Hiyo4]|nr:hypothetical protein AHiyo4_44600 [Arthrobacter sp. Hiyo4]